MFNSILQNIAKPFNRSNSQNTEWQTEPLTQRSDRIEDGFLLVGDTASERTIIQAANLRSHLIDASPNYTQVTNYSQPTGYTTANVCGTQSLTLNSSQLQGVRRPMHSAQPSLNTGSNWIHDNDRITSTCNLQSPTLDALQMSGMHTGNPRCQTAPSGFTRTNNPLCKIPDSSTYVQQTIPSHSITAISDVPFVLGHGYSSVTHLQNLKDSSELGICSFDSSQYIYDFRLEQSYLNEHNSMASSSH